METIDTLLSKPDFSKEDLIDVRIELQTLGTVNFLTALFKSYPNRFSCEVSLGLLDDWHNMAYLDLKNVVRGLSTTDVGLIHFIPFIGKYFEIDLRVEVNDRIPKKTYDSVVSYLGTGPSPLFYFDIKYDSKILNRFGITFDFLQNIKSRLIAEGATKAKSIKPKIIKL